MYCLQYSTTRYFRSVLPSSTVLLEALPGTRYPQDPVPGVRAFVLPLVQYYMPDDDDDDQDCPLI